MTGNTIENKKKFFGCYYGQEVAKCNNGPGNVCKVTHHSFAYGNPERFHLLLTPLEHITDEDAIEVAEAGHDATHNAWMEKKIVDGWVYGPVKDEEAKTHPCIIPFEQLSEFERKKDELICAIVNILK